mgnify:CR=1 FL=1
MRTSATIHPGRNFMLTGTTINLQTTEITRGGLVSRMAFSIFLAPMAPQEEPDEAPPAEMHVLPTGSSSVAPGLTMPLPAW